MYPIADHAGSIAVLELQGCGEESKQVILELPIPPSVNHCWRFTSRGVFKKSRYIHWLAESAIEANRQAFQGCTGPVSVAIQVIPGEGWNIMRDIDNVAKCTLDFLGSGGHISGDDCRTLQVLSISVGMPEPKACIRVTIQAITNPIQILTKAEAKQPKVEASTHITVEDEPRDSFFYSLEELRAITREAKSRGKAMAAQISAQCDACR